MRRKARIDSNHAEIVRSAEKLGCLVHSLAAHGNGLPDLLIQLPPSHGRRLILVEVKDGTKPPSQRTLTDDQKRFIERGWVVNVVSSLDELMALLKRL